MKNVWLAVRSIIWALLLPGLVAFYVPWRFFGFNQVAFTPEAPFQAPGFVMFILGVALLVACIWEFARSGKGTLSPADPPKKLVVQGLYRYVRNPMYLAVSLILIGEHMMTHSFGLFVYWAIWFAITNVFVIFVEEPALRRQFGEPYREYTRTVGRWIPRFARSAGHKA